MQSKAMVVLEDRGVISIHGPETLAFLQGLISNDVTKVSDTRAIYATLLTPQGKFLHDFFIAAAVGLDEAEAAGRVPARDRARLLAGATLAAGVRRRQVCLLLGGISLVCFEVLITRIELLTLSLTALEQNPMVALRASFLTTSSSYLGNFESRKLNVKNHGKWPAYVAPAAASDPW